MFSDSHLVYLLQWMYSTMHAHRTLVLVGITAIALVQLFVEILRLKQSNVVPDKPFASCPYSCLDAYQAESEIEDFDEVLKNVQAFSGILLMSDHMTKCGSTTLLFIISSSEEHFGRRQAIRATWASQRNQRVDFATWRSVFLVGKPSHEFYESEIYGEAQHYGDVLVGNFTDIYQHLSIKTIMGMRWGVHHCEFKYLVKTDDDVFINIPNLMQFLNRESTPKNRLYAGQVHYQTKPHRQGKYRVSELEYPDRPYPRFAAGGCIILSRDVAAKMLQSHVDMNFFKLEDVYLGMLALQNGIDPIDVPEVHLMYRDVSCFCKRFEIVHHTITDRKCMEKLYKCSL